MQSRLHFGKNGHSTTKGRSSTADDWGRVDDERAAESPAVMGRVFRCGESLIRRHPGMSLAAGFVVGLVLGKLVKR